MDPRTERTRQALKDALFELARDNGVGHVTVSDIAERAGVNRSTFYQHYQDTDTLLADALDDATQRAGANLETIVAELTDRPPEAVVAFLRHIAENRELYRSAFVDPGSPAFVARVRERLMVLAEAAVRLSHGAEALGVPVDMVASGITGSIVGIITAWLERYPDTDGDQAAEWLWVTVLSAPPGLAGPGAT